MMVIFFLLLTGTSLGAIEIYPVTAVKRGLVGVGYTVVEGTAVEPFSVEVLGVMERAGPAGSLVLVRTSGNLIDRIGGIASGMSGSPVYIDGKLLGAIGYGFEFADHRIGLVTPAADMLAVMDLIATEKAASIESPEDHQSPIDDDDRSALQELGSLPSAVVLADSASQAQSLAGTLPPDVWVAAPVATPLVVSGLGPRTMNRLEKLFANYNVVPMQAGSPQGVELDDVPLVPGGSMGVQLVRGDVDVAAIGTVTAVDGGRFVAFGHPFLNRGDVDHFATGAYILHTVPSLSFPFKIGAPTAPIGRLLQDRGAAIAGVVGERPETVTMSVHVSDRDRGVEERFHVEVARDRELTVPLVLVSALEAVDRALDRLGPGTSRVAFRIDGEGMPRSFERENIFYSGSDIAAASLSELWIGLDLLQSNEFQDPVIDEIDVAIEVESERQTARIENAEPVSRRVQQGETVDVVVTLRPFRAPAFDVTIPLEIPADTPRGPVIVSVRGGIFGGYAPLPEASDGSLALPVGDDETEGDSPLSIEAESLEKLIDEFENEPRNNEVVVEFYPSFFRGGRDFLRSDEDSQEDEEAGDVEDTEEADDIDHVQESGDSDKGADDDENEMNEGDEEEAALEVDEEMTGDPVDYGPVRAVYPTAYVVHGEAQFTLTITSRRETVQEDEAPAIDETLPPSAPVEPWPDPGVYPIHAQ